MEAKSLHVHNSHELIVPWLDNHSKYWCLLRAIRCITRWYNFDRVKVNRDGVIEPPLFYFNLKSK